MLSASWDVIAPPSSTWEDITFHNPETTWEQIFNSYQITDPGIEVVTDINDKGSCSVVNALPTIVIYDTDPGNESSSENVNIIRLLNRGCHIGLNAVERVYIVLPNDQVISSQTIPSGIYWDDWFIYFKLGKNDLWADLGEGFYRMRLLIRLTGSVVPYFWGLIRFKIMLGGEVI
jgi:hypothetical protein